MSLYKVAGFPKKGWQYEGTIDYKEENNIMFLNFNEYLFGDLNIHNISEEITYSINLSLNDNYNIDSVMYSINDDFINNYFLLRG